MRRALFVPVSLAIILLPCTAGAAGKARISPETCRLISRHLPDDGVAFQPGAGGHGKPVVPADIDGGAAIEPPGTFMIDITDLLADRVEVPAAPGDYLPEANMGHVLVRNGRLSYNGRELPQSAARAIAEACRRTLP